MLLGFITGILNKYIGAYFEDIDASQLTGSIFGGGVTLHDINLRPSVLENVGLPFHVVAGKCGTLEVKYSLTRLYSEPVTVTLKDLYLLVIPARCVRYDEKQEAKNLQDEKMRQLEIFESIKHHVKKIEQHKTNKTREAVPDVASLLPTDASYFDMWVMTVLRNILLTIESVHVRFEDDITKKGEPFALGLLVEKFSVLTTDKTWKALFLKDYAPETIFKLVDITGLNMYWNPSPAVMYKELNDKKIVFLRMSALPKDDETIYQTMFGPVSLNLKIQVTPFPDNLQDPYSKPRIFVESRLETLTVTASDKQFHDIIPFCDTMDLLMKSHKHRKHRNKLHNCEYKGHYKEWWRYAYECILDDIVRRRNNFRWNVISEHREKCKKYLKAYYRKKVESKVVPEVETTLHKLEKELDLLNLILVRKQAEILVNRSKSDGDASAMQREEQSYLGWFVSWAMWTNPPQPPPVPVQTPGTSTRTPPPTPKRQSKELFLISSLTKEEKEELRIAVGFARNNDLGSYPEDYVDVEANILLNRFLLHINSVKKRKETILDGVLDAVSFVLRVRPVEENIQVEVKMGRVEAYGGDIPKGQHTDLFSPPQILTTANPAGTEYFLKLMYEKAPLDSEVDHKVSLEGLALQFTYHAEAMDKLIDCFTVPPPPVPKGKPQKFPAGKLTASKVLNRVMKFKSSPTAKLLRVMENKGKIELSICLISPYIVIPLDASSIRGKANFVVVHLGEINVVGNVIGGTICESGGCSNFI